MTVKERTDVLDELGRSFRAAMAAVRRLRGRETHRPGELSFAQYSLLFGLARGGERRRVGERLQRVRRAGEAGLGWQDEVEVVRVALGVELRQGVEVGQPQGRVRRRQPERHA